MTKHNRKCLTGALTLALLTGCGAPKKWDANRQLLQSGLDSFEAQDYGKTASKMDKLLVGTNGNAADRSMYAVQRYYAAFMTARAHLEASFGQTFLKEKGSSFSFGGADGGASAPSYIGHLAAANYHAGYAGSWYSAAEESPHRWGEGDGATWLLPEALDSFGVKNSRLNMVLSLVAIQSRLQFQERVNPIIEDFPALQNLASCEEQLDNAQVSDNVRPWVYLGIWGYMVTVPGREPEAFRYAVRAIDTGLASGGSISDSELQPLRDWIAFKSRYEFVCPENDDIIADGTDTACPVCYRSYQEYIPRPREVQ